MDRLIGTNWRNSGGNEVAISRTDAYLRYDTDGQVTNFAKKFVTNFTRLDGRNQTWKPIYTTWDSDWEPSNLQQVISVWEDDTRGTIEWNGSITT